MSTSSQTSASTQEDNEDFEDPPLEPVVNDDISIEVAIGPPSAFERRVVSGSDRKVISPTSDARSYNIVDAEIELSDDKLSNYVDAVITADDHRVRPKPGEIDGEEQEIITIDVDNQLTEARRDSNEITRIFTGMISNSSRYDEMTFEIIAFWPNYSTIQNSTVVISPPLPANILGEPTTYTDRRRKASYILELAAERIAFGNPFESNIEVSDAGVEVVIETADGDDEGDEDSASESASGQTTDTLSRTYGINVQSVFQGVEEISTILETLKKETNSVWEIDRYGDFYFGPPNPDRHKLRYITDTDAGYLSPQWRSIKVIGDGVVTAEGWEGSAMFNEDPVTSSENLSNQNRDGELVEPTFVYKNMQLQTEEQVENVRQSIKEDIENQRAEGTITIVGHPEVWPGDAVTMPDAPGQPFALDKYAINKVVHRINNSDGFITKIETAGLTQTEGAFASDTDVSIRNKEYSSIAMRSSPRPVFYNEDDPEWVKRGEDPPAIDNYRDEGDVRSDAVDSLRDRTENDN